MAGVTVSLTTSPEISNFAQLLAELQSLLQRDDVGPRLKIYTRTVESVINRRLSRERVRPSIQTCTYTANGTLPLRFLAEVDVSVGSQRLTPVDLSRAAFMAESISREYGQNQNDYPPYYVMRGNDIEFYPPLAGKSVSFTYVQRLTPLSEVEPVNWMLTAHPDVYLYGCAAYADIWEDDDQRARDFLTLFETFLTDALESYPARDESTLRLDPMFPMASYGRRWSA